MEDKTRPHEMQGMGKPCARQPWQAPSGKELLWAISIYLSLQCKMQAGRQAVEQHGQSIVVSYVCIMIEAQ